MLLILLFSLITGFISFLLSNNMLGVSAQSSAYFSGLMTVGSLLFLSLFYFLAKSMSLRSAIGLAVGLVVSSIFFFAFLEILNIINLPSDLSVIVKILSFTLITALGITIGVYKTIDSEKTSKGFSLRSKGVTKILDTSVIIDGRIADVAEAGFIEGEIIIPKFIIKELQYIADSGEPTKRVRGRRGLDVLNKMQNEIPDIVIKITNQDFPKIKEVDLKLVELAKKLKGIVITNDFNLNKVAGLEGVKVLNLNELSNSLKPIVLPGEIINLQLVKEGKEQNQALGYLDDGTMVVVDDARRYMGKEVDVSVTSVLQTSTGRMIFAKIDKEDMVSSLNG